MSPSLRISVFVLSISLTYAQFSYISSFLSSLSLSRGVVYKRERARRGGMLCDGLSEIGVKIFFCQERDLNAFRGRLTIFFFAKTTDEKQKTTHVINSF